MKRLFLITAVLLLSQAAFSQLQQIKYERLDHFEEKFNPLLSGKHQSIQFNLIRLTDLVNDSSLYGVEVVVRSVKRLRVGSSHGRLKLDGDWKHIDSDIYKRINQKGYILLSRTKLEEIRDFINQALMATGKKQENYVRYKLTLNDKMKVGLFHNPEKLDHKYGLPHEQWTFFFRINQSSYRTHYKQGLILMRKLNAYRERLEELEVQSG